MKHASEKFSRLHTVNIIVWQMDIEAHLFAGLFRRYCRKGIELLLVSAALWVAESNAEESYQLRFHGLRCVPQQRFEFSGGWSQRLTQSLEGNPIYETNRLEFNEVQGVLTILRWDITNQLFEGNLDIEKLRSGNVSKTNILLKDCRIRAKYISGMSFFKAENGFLDHEAEEALQRAMHLFPWTDMPKKDYEFLNLEQKRSVGEVWEPDSTHLAEVIRRKYPDFRGPDMKSSVQFTEITNISGFPCFTVMIKIFVPLTAYNVSIELPYYFKDLTGNMEAGEKIMAPLNSGCYFNRRIYQEYEGKGHVIRAQTNLNARFVYRVESRIDLKPIQAER
jgi:hypothetical protein